MYVNATLKALLLTLLKKNVIRNNSTQLFLHSPTNMNSSIQKMALSGKMSTDNRTLYILTMDLIKNVLLKLHQYLFFQPH